MPDTRQAQIEALFQAAADLGPAQRAEWLERHCGDAGLRSEVQRLLLCLEDNPEFLEQPAYSRSGDAAPPKSEPPLPERLGRFRLIRILGQGGMGTVYEAEQDHPRRTVALKVIRGAAPSAATLKRFEREAQLLGQLQHPGIAQIYDAGTVPASGAGSPAPYLAMELVRGATLSEYARNHAIDTRRRLEIFASICDAVAHAHQHGILHRDLKPGNILIVAGDDSGAPAQPKILDFGIARPLQTEATPATLHTLTGEFIGTLTYMSPEQVRGAPADLDQRSDIYSLGVILFELLSGRLPYDIRYRPLPEALRVICEDEPSQLSSSSNAGGLRFDRDLTTIVAKCLEKDRERRYATAGELAADVRHFLRDEPIRARPATALYQMRKFARRHRALVGGVLTTFAALLIGLMGMTRLAFLERDQRRVADQKSRAAQESEALAQAEATRATRATYYARIAAAQAALDSQDAPAALRNLEAAPAELRGWEWRHLASRLDASLAVIPLPEDPGPRRPFLLDGGKRLAVTFVGSGLPWKCVDCGDLHETPAPACPPFLEAALGDDGEHLVYVPESGPLRLRNLRTNAEKAWDAQAAGIPSNSFVLGLSISPAGERFYFYQHHTMAVWCVDTATGAARHHAAEAAGAGRQALSVSPDNRVAVSSLLDGAPGIWNPADDSVVQLQGHRAAGTAVAFMPGGRRVVTASRDAALRICDAQSGACLAIGRGHTDDVADLAVSADGKLIASAGGDGTLRFWSGEELEPLGVQMGHSGRLHSVMFLPGDQRVATVAEDKTLRIWDTRNAGDMWALRGHTSYVYPVAVSPDGRMVASGGWDNTIRLWDAQLLRPLAVLAGHKSYVGMLTFSPSGRYLASTSADAEWIVWDVQSGRWCARLAEPGTGSYARRPIFLDDERVVLRRSCEGELEIWLWRSGARGQSSVSELAGADDEVLGADGRLLAQYEPESAQLVIRRARDGAEVCRPGARWFGHVAFDPRWRGETARFVAPMHADPQSIGVWNAWDGKLLGQLRGHTRMVFAVAFSPDGKRIATGGQDASIRIWDAETLTEIAQLRGHTSYVWDLAFSVDGELLVSGSGDGTVRVWDTRAGREHLLGSEARRSEASDERNDR